MINWIMVVVFTMFGMLFGRFAAETGSDLARWMAGLNGVLVILNLVAIESRRQRGRAPRVEVSVLPPEDPYMRPYERKRRRQRGQGGDGSTG